MRTVLALCFIALFAGAMAHKSKAPVEESKFVSSLKTLFQIAAPEEVDEVAEVLAAVREEVENILAKTRAGLAEEQDDHDDTAGSYEENIESLANNLAQTKTDLENAKQIAGELQVAIDNSLNAINEAQAEQDNERARRTDYHNSFRTKVDQLQAAVDAAQDALRLLQEIDTQDLSGSFLEINNKKIKNNFEAIHNNLANLKLKSTVTPITKMLVEIAAAGLNHDLIAQIQDLLTQLVDTLQKEVDDAVADDNNDDSYSRNTLATLQDTVDVESASADANQGKLSEVESDIERLNAAGSNFAETLAQAQDALDALNEQWESRLKNRQAVIRRLVADIDALEAAENFVDRD